MIKKEGVFTVAFLVLILLISTIIALNLFTKNIDLEEEELKDDLHSWWP